MRWNPHVVVDGRGLSSTLSRAPVSGSDMPFGNINLGFSPLQWFWNVTSGSQIPMTSHLSTCNSFTWPLPRLCMSLPVRRTLHPFVNLTWKVRERHITELGHNKRVRVIRTQNSLQSFRTAPVIHGGERDSLLFSDGLDVTSHEEFSLRVRISGKELSDCRLKPARGCRCTTTEEHFDHSLLRASPLAHRNRVNT